MKKYVISEYCRDIYGLHGNSSADLLAQELYPGCSLSGDEDSLVRHVGEYKTKNEAMSALSGYDTTVRFYDGYNHDYYAEVTEFVVEEVDCEEDNVDSIFSGCFDFLSSEIYHRVILSGDFNEALPYKYDTMWVNIYVDGCCHSAKIERVACDDDFEEIDETGAHFQLSVDNRKYMSMYDSYDYFAFDIEKIENDLMEVQK